jgi:hypothetical protein
MTSSRTWADQRLHVAMEYLRAWPVPKYWTKKTGPILRYLRRSPDRVRMTMRERSSVGRQDDLIAAGERQ